MKKNPFDIDLALQQVEEAVRPFPKAGLFELAPDEEPENQMKSTTEKKEMQWILILHLK